MNAVSGGAAKADAMMIIDDWKLDVSAAEEPRVMARDVAERAGMAEPRRARRLVEANREELEQHGEIVMRARRSRIRKRGKDGCFRGYEERVTYEPWLNEAQAVTFVALMRTKTAMQLRVALVKLFVAYRRGTIAPPAPVTNVIGAIHAARIADQPEKKRLLQAKLKACAEATATPVRRLHGRLRKEWKVPGPFLISAEMFQPLLEDIERFTDEHRNPRQLRLALVWLPAKR